MTTTAAAPEAAVPPSDARRVDVRLAVAGAALSLVVGTVGYLAAAAQLAWPDLLPDAALLSYGRLLPLATGLVLFGGISVLLLAAAVSIVPRVTGAPSRARLLGAGGPLLVLAGSVAGSVAVALGGNAGGRYLEFPLWADAVVAAGALAVAVSVTATARTVDRLPLPAWYLVAAPWWLLLAWAVGAAPGVTGVATALQGWFSVTSLTGMWFAAAGLGIAYHLVGKLGVAFHPRLGFIGFWSLAFTWAWTAGRNLQYGPTADWLETIPVVFSIGVVLAVVTILADFGLALAGRFELTRGSAPLRLVLAGLALFALMPLHMVVQSLRGSSAVVHLTPWETAFEELMLFGAFTAWGLAFALDALEQRRGKKVSGALAAAGTWAMVVGLGAALFSRWFAGLQVGYTWVGGVNSDVFANAGNGFRNSVIPIDGLQAVNAIGLAAVLVGLVLLGAALVGGLLGSPRAEVDGLPFDPEVPTIPPRVVLGGAAALFTLALVAVFVGPAIESSGEPSLLAEHTRDFAAGSPEDLGRDLYLKEGCWYCHTQQVRSIVTDVGLGTVSVPGDYAFDDADLLGVLRIGPDLAHAGSRSPTDDTEWLAAHLADPRAARPWSTMPGYGHLDPAELEALAAYIAALD